MEGHPVAAGTLCMTFDAFEIKFRMTEEEEEV